VCWSSQAIKFYYTEYWNIVDVLVICLYVVILGLEIDYISDSRRKNFSLGRTDFVDYEHLSIKHDRLFDLFGVMIGLAFVKLFKYMNLSRRIHLMWCTIHRVCGGGGGVKWWLCVH